MAQPRVAPRQLFRALILGNCAAQQVTGKVQVPVQVSELPPIYLVDDFAAPDEMEELYAMAEPHLAQAEVLASNLRSEDKTPLSRKAKSYTVHDHKWTDSVAELMQRVDAVTMRPHRYGQHVLVTRYDVGDFYDLHVDSSIQVGRQLTAILFLEESQRGGELVFPWAVRSKYSGEVEGVSGKGLPAIDKQFIATDWPLNDTLCGEASQALRISPRAGRLVVFQNHNSMGQTLKPRAYHASCPILEGHKRIAQRWYQIWPLRDGSFDFPGNLLYALLYKAGLVAQWNDELKTETEYEDAEL